jgi:acetylornithine/succinyldiaminopimelate/putrescine aminotransferase
LDVIEDERLAARAAKVGQAWMRRLSSVKGVAGVRGRGLMVGLKLNSSPLSVVRALLERGFLTLPAGTEADVLQLVPALNIREELLDLFTETLAEVLS